MADGISLLLLPADVYAQPGDADFPAFLAWLSGPECLGEGSQRKNRQSADSNLSDIERKACTCAQFRIDALERLIGNEPELCWARQLIKRCELLGK